MVLLKMCQLRSEFSPSQCFDILTTQPGFCVAAAALSTQLMNLSLAIRFRAGFNNARRASIHILIAERVRVGA